MLAGVFLEVSMGRNGCSRVSRLGVGADLVVPYVALAGEGRGMRACVTALVGLHVDFLPPWVGNSLSRVINPTCQGGLSWRRAGGRTWGKRLAVVLEKSVTWACCIFNFLLLNLRCQCPISMH